MAWQALLHASVAVSLLGSAAVEAASDCESGGSPTKRSMTPTLLQTQVDMQPGLAVGGEVKPECSNQWITTMPCYWMNTFKNKRLDDNYLTAHTVLIRNGKPYQIAAGKGDHPDFEVLARRLAVSKWSLQADDPQVVEGGLEGIDEPFLVRWWSKDDGFKMVVESMHTFWNHAATPPRRDVRIHYIVEEVNDQAIKVMDCIKESCIRKFCEHRDLLGLHVSEHSFASFRCDVKKCERCAQGCRDLKGDVAGDAEGKGQ